MPSDTPQDISPLRSLAGYTVAPSDNGTDQLVSRLRDIVGAGRVSPTPETDINGLRPRVAISPADTGQLAAILALAHADGLATCVTGGGTKLAWGNRPSRCDLLIGTRDLRGLSDVDADNLSVSVMAGTPVVDARAQVLALGRVLPIDPATPGAATVGGVVATGDVGPRGAAYGGLRDVVLGLRAILSDGTAVKFGGRTMKNVTGYDMTKLFVGSFGCLGVVTEVTFRLLPRPETQALMLLPVESLDHARVITAQILDSHLQPLALEVISAGFAARAAAAGDAESLRATAGAPLLLAGFAGHPEVVARSLREVGGQHSLRPIAVLEGSEAEAAFAALADAVQIRAGDTMGVAARITAPLSRVWELAETAESQAAASGLSILYRVGAARGTVDLWVDAQSDAQSTALLASLRRETVASGGSLSIRDGLVRLATGFDAWGETDSSVQLMSRIKERFDPRNTLNPGRFVGGI